MVAQLSDSQAVDEMRLVFMSDSCTHNLEVWELIHRNSIKFQDKSRPNFFLRGPRTDGLNL